MISNSLTRDDLALLLADQDAPCVSLYQPTHRRHPENQQDPVRYRNLLKMLEESLGLQYSSKSAEEILNPFQRLADDASFWNHTEDGLAVMGNSSLFRVFKLQRPVPELAVVADSFHVKPLLRIVQSADRYQVLSLNRREIKLFEGNRDVLDEIELAEDIPGTITEALGPELTEPHQTVSSYGGTALGSSMRHAHGSRKDELDIDDERFFRAVDRGILEKHSRPSELPLILAALPQHHHLFHQVSHNPLLLTTGIMMDPNTLAIDQLREKAWEIMEPEFRARLKKLADEFLDAKSKGLGSDHLETIAEAATRGRIESLMVEADRHISGRIDPTTGSVKRSELEHPEVDDLLDDLAEHVLKTGGQVVVVPSLQMPAKTGAAASFRF
jgi:hypothetical protein